MSDPQGPTFRELVVEALSSTDRGYDLIAPKFEHTSFRTPEPILRVAVEAISAGGPVGRALDLCCGTAPVMRAVRPLCREDVVGIDRSAGMLAEAWRLLADAEGTARVSLVRGDARISLVRGDARELPFREAFDLVTCFGAFGHILEEDEPRFVRQLARALRPGGRFVFATSDPISPLRPAWWLARGFNAAMRLRNALLQPKFIMYYLTFLAPRAKALLEAEGLAVEFRRGVFPKPFTRLVLGIASRPVPSSSIGRS